MDEIRYDYYTKVFIGLFFVVATSFSLLINFLILRFSSNLGMRNVAPVPGQVRWATTSKPSLGGFSFYMIFLMSIAVLGLMPVTIEDTTFFNKKLIGLLASCSLGFLIGLADDAYNTNPLVKFIGQFTSANLLITTGYVIEATPFIEVNYFITLLWIIGLMNSVNMLDNMDAITGSTSVVTLVGALFLIIIDGSVDNVYLIIIFGVLGALLGFLYFNWNPSKMYMGDTGSQFLGVFLAGISILFFWNYHSTDRQFIEIKQFLIPCLMFIVPLFDTTTVFMRRIYRRQSPFVGGKDHITHHLAYLGLPDKYVAVVLIGLSTLSIPIVIFIYSVFDNWEFVYTVLVITYLVSVFLILQVLYNIGKRKQAKKMAKLKAVKEDSEGQQNIVTKTAS